MKRSVVMLIAALTVIGTPLPAARTAVVAIAHPAQKVFQTYRTTSSNCSSSYRGYAGLGGRTIDAVPGVLRIVPGSNWSNYVGAARDGVPYSIKNVVLEKRTPAIIQCADILSSHTVAQQGTRNIRLWWPLMYEIAGTTWTLTILYGTPAAYDDDGPAGPNPPAYVHTETWKWELGITLEGMKSLLSTMHSLPFGKSQVPVISDEVFYASLEAKFDEILWAMMAGDSVQAGLLLGEFEMLLMDKCIAVAPSKPNPSGFGTGVAQTAENPACCELLADAEYLGFELGIYQPRK